PKVSGRGGALAGASRAISTKRRLGSAEDVASLVTGFPTRLSPPARTLFELIHQLQRQCDEANDDARKYERWAAKDHDCDLANDVTGLLADSPTKPFPEPHRKEQGQAQRHD